MENVVQATPESVWAALRESNRFLTEKLAKLTESQAETDRILSEKIAATDRILTEKIAATDRQIEKVSKQIAKTDKMVGGISTNNGLFAEEYFYNSLRKGKKILMGEKFDKLIKSEILEDENGKTKGELDIILINGESLVIVEVKFKVRDRHVDRVMKKVKPFRERFPEYRNHTVYLGLASMVFDEDIVDKCKENGIAVIKQEGDSVVVHDENLKAF
jgi:hypothetical protein